MKTPLLPSALGALCILMLASCVDPNYYGSSYGVYGSASYSTLPYGYRTVHVSGVPYYYYGNRWYRHHSGRYVVCSRPYGYHGSIGRSYRYHGHGISRLPYGYRTVTIGGHRYYNHGNHWYRRSGSRYVTCSKPSGYKHYDRHKSHSHTHKYKTRDSGHHRSRSDSRHDRSKSRSPHHKTSEKPSTYKHRSHSITDSIKCQSSPRAGSSQKMRMRPVSTAVSTGKRSSPSMRAKSMAGSTNQAGRSKNDRTSPRPFKSLRSRKKEKSQRD